MKKAMKMQLDKCPRLSYLKNRITHTQKEIEELNNLIRLSDEELSKDKSEFEKCEIRIKVLRANKNLPTCYVDLEKTEADFKKWKSHIQKFMDEANVDYEEVIAKARKQILVNDNIKRIFEEYKQFDVVNNFEAKVSFYANLKTEMNKEPEEKILPKN
jgi:septal ring factor EnvC (AmiA/AmiB activator)